MAFAKGERVFLPGSAEFATVESVVPKAEGLWAEQFYEIRIEGRDLCSFTVQEAVLAQESSAPDWSEADLPGDHPASSLR